jgi:hypothetical protein
MSSACPGKLRTDDTLSNGISREYPLQLTTALRMKPGTTLVIGVKHTSAYTAYFCCLLLIHILA